MACFCVNSKYLRVMVIQIFLNLGEFWWNLPIPFHGYGILFKIFKGIWDTMDPFQGLRYGSGQTAGAKTIFHLAQGLPMVCR